jgi:hypothetical protein
MYKLVWMYAFPLNITYSIPKAINAGTLVLGYQFDQFVAGDYLRLVDKKYQVVLYQN